MCCNLCRKPFTTTIFVLACDCAFCEECTYDHFTKYSDCPTCKKVLTKADFAEFQVAEPSATSEANYKNCMQFIFTKRASGGKGLTNVDACSRALKQIDSNTRAVKFLFRQFTKEKTNDQLKIDSMKHENHTLKEELTHHKTLLHTHQQDADHKLADMQTQLANTTMALQEQKKQNAQLREMYAKKCDDLPPASSHTHGSGGRRGPSSHSSQQQQQFGTQVQPTQGHSRQQHRSNQHQVQPQFAPHHRNPQQQQPQPPMRNMAPRVSLGVNTVRPVSAATRNGYEPFTPIQVPPQYRSTGSGGSTGSAHSRTSSNGGGRMHDSREQYAFHGGAPGGGGSKYSSGSGFTPSSRFQTGASFGSNQSYASFGQR
ncbi:hypothetical protein MPSEU_000739200 [Mayamaea pseudoterrestris]|nr:hypothetical protein MPSEU_000739200 [Mayamaea pseudoterrestris]